MANSTGNIDKGRASRAGNSFQERWTARRTLDLVFSQESLHAIAVEGPATTESLEFSEQAKEIADLVLYFGSAANFAECSGHHVFQFKYRESKCPETVTAHFLKKTIKKFCAMFRDLKREVENDEIQNKHMFIFVTNAVFSKNLRDAIVELKNGCTMSSINENSQYKSLRLWCREENVKAEDLFAVFTLNSGSEDLATLDNKLRRTINDWSSNATNLAASRMYELVDLVRRKSQREGIVDNLITREDVLSALGCEADDLFPARSMCPAVDCIVKRDALSELQSELEACELPICLHGEGGVGKTTLIHSLADALKTKYQVVVFDCYAGGRYRSQTHYRHSPKDGLIQIINELAARGLCDPLLPIDRNDSTKGLITRVHKRFQQVMATMGELKSGHGLLIILDAADIAHLIAREQKDQAFPSLLLDSLSCYPIPGVKLLLTMRTYRMDAVVGSFETKNVNLGPFTEEETRRYLEVRRGQVSNHDLEGAFVRSSGNARVLSYLMDFREQELFSTLPYSKVTIDEIVDAKCKTILKNLRTEGYCDSDSIRLFTAISLLPPPIPVTILAKIMNWKESQVKSVVSDLAPMLEIVAQCVTCRDEHAEAYFRDNHGAESDARQSIVEKLRDGQVESIYAAEAFPCFLKAIGDCHTADQLASACTKTRFGHYGKA